MNRRSFLASLAAIPFLDPERLLWIPGQKKIFIPPVKRIITDGIWINLEATRRGFGFDNGLHSNLSQNDFVSFVSFSELDSVCQRAFLEYERFWGYSHGQTFQKGEYATITF